MSLPFSTDQFFAVFARYNLGVWPAQLVLLALGIGCLVALYAGPQARRMIGWALAALWAWMAIAYHFMFFSSINPAAWLFGAAFAIASILFARHAYAGTLRFSRPKGIDQVAGWTAIAYALAIYPWLGAQAGHVFPRSPTFGLPCPTTIFTLGMLLLAERPVPRSLFVVPLGWSAIATFAAIELGVPEDFGLPAAALITFAVLLRRALPIHTRRSPAS